MHIAVILCGGLATRMASVAAATPKVLLPVGGRPFLSYLLDSLQRQGIEQIILSTGHLGEQVDAYLRDCRQENVRCVRERRPLGTGGALRLAADTLQHSGPLLVLNGDTFFSGALAALAAFHDRSTNACGTLALTRVENADRYGHVELCTQSGAVTRFAEKHPAAARAAWISAGMYLLEPVLIQSIPVAQQVSLEQQVFPAWVGRGLYGCRFEGARFLDFGTPEDYALAQRSAHHFQFQEGA